MPDIETTTERHCTAQELHNIAVARAQTQAELVIALDLLRYVDCVTTERLLETTTAYSRNVVAGIIAKSDGTHSTSDALHELLCAGTPEAFATYTRESGWQLTGRGGSYIEAVFDTHEQQGFFDDLPKRLTYMIEAAKHDCPPPVKY